MQTYSNLKELVALDQRSRSLFASFPPEKQVALMEQRQNIRTYDELASAAQGAQKQTGGWQAT